MPQAIMAQVLGRTAPSGRRNEILIQTDQPAAVVAGHLRVLAQRYPGPQVSDCASLVTANAANDELNHWLGPFFGVSALLALVALSVPTRRALRTRPVEAIGIRE
jgi:hypothetical protein